MPTTNEILSVIQRRSSLPLPGWEDWVEESQAARATRIADYLNEREDRDYGYACDECGAEPCSKEAAGSIHLSPYDDDAEELHFCSEECRERYEQTSGFWCEECNRFISNLSSNSMIAHERVICDGATRCLSCHVKDLLENGINTERDLDQLAEGMLPGVWFNLGNDEALDAGFEEHGEQRFIRNGSDALKTAREIEELMDTYKVIIAYENLSIMGDEGWISIYKKARSALEVQEALICRAEIERSFRNES